jgi:hypothetical protein
MLLLDMETHSKKSDLVCRVEIEVRAQHRELTKGENRRESQS